MPLTGSRFLIGSSPSYQNASFPVRSPGFEHQRYIPPCYCVLERSRFVDRGRGSTMKSLTLSKHRRGVSTQCQIREVIDDLLTFGNTASDVLAESTAQTSCERQATIERRSGCRSAKRSADHSVLGEFMETMALDLAFAKCCAKLDSLLGSELC